MRRPAVWLAIGPLALPLLWWALRLGGAWLAANQINNFMGRAPPRRYNGAMFLGLNGICIKSHGGADAIGFANAIHVAVELITHSFNDGIKEDYALLSGHPPTLDKAVVGE